MGDSPERFNNDHNDMGAQRGVGLNVQDLSTSVFIPQERESTEFQPISLQTQRASAQDLSTQDLNTRKPGKKSLWYQTRPGPPSTRSQPPPSEPKPSEPKRKENQPVFTNEESAANTTVDLGLKIFGLLADSFVVGCKYQKIQIDIGHHSSIGYLDTYSLNTEMVCCDPAEDQDYCGTTNKWCTIDEHQNSRQNYAMYEAGSEKQSCKHSFDNAMAACGWLALLINCIFVPALLLRAATLTSDSSSLSNTQKLKWPILFGETDHFRKLSPLGKRAFRLQIFAITLAFLGGIFGIACALLPIEKGMGAYGAYLFLVSSLYNVILTIYAFWQVMTARGRLHLERKQKRKIENETEFFQRLKERKSKSKKQAEKFTRQAIWARINSLFEDCIYYPVARTIFTIRQAFPFL